MAKKTKNESAGIRAQVPALDSYLTRIGAEELNFRRFMVKTYVKGGNYYIEKTLIRINADGAITCTNREGGPDHSPTDDERKAIAAGILTFKFPMSVGASLRAAQAQADKLGGETYLFCRRSDKSIVMIQQKWIKESGEKVYPCWSLWSDGIWRMMEPDGDLPFWKPIGNKGTPPGLKMVHEGAKAAKFIDELCHDTSRRKELAAHPWGEELMLYEHWGMIGGALAPHRADYSELRAEMPTEVVYVCDNDYPGKAALPIVSQCYGDHLVGVMFTDNFKASWDMADPLPEKLFSSQGHYNGSPLKNFKRSSTWATEAVPVPGTKKTTLRMRRPFLEEWVHSVEPEFFIHKDRPNRMLKSDPFNSQVAPYSGSKDTAALMRTSDAIKAHAIKYDPSREPGVYEDRRGSYINTHVPCDIPAVKGDTKPFTDFINYLVVRDDDRLELMRWCATLIAMPAVKMSYGVLLISEMQGVGKGTLGEKILAPLVGSENASFPSETDIVDSAFNAWLAHRRLAVIHEIYAGGTPKAYDKLKPLVTDKNISVNEKNQPRYDVESWVHFYACSNSTKALRLEDSDRRWYLPKITEEQRPDTYWEVFHDWLENQGGLSIIRWWAEDFLQNNKPVKIGARAPWSAVKDDVVRDGYSQGQRLVDDTLTRVTEVLDEDADEDDVRLRQTWETKGMLIDGAVVILDVDLVRLIKTVVYSDKPHDKLERPGTVRRVAKDQHWFVGDKGLSRGMKAWGHHPKAYVISNKEQVALTDPAMLGGRPGEKAGRKLFRPLDLSFITKIM